MIRPLNLGIIFLSFLLAFHLAERPLLNRDFILIAAWLFLAAAGYVFNDISDKEADQVNRPGRPLPGGFPPREAMRLLIILASGALLLALFLPFPLLLLTLLVGSLLYLYSRLPAKGPFLGNVAVALATASPFLSVILSRGYTPLLGLAFLFSFIIIWMREIAKDFEDMDGDRRAGRRTLPLTAGRKRGLLVLWVLTFILAGFTMWGSLTVRETGVYALMIMGGVNLCNTGALISMRRGLYRRASLVYKLSILLGMGGLWLSV